MLSPTNTENVHSFTPGRRFYWPKGMSIILEGPPPAAPTTLDPEPTGPRGRDQKKIETLTG